MTDENGKEIAFGIKPFDWGHMGLGGYIPETRNGAQYLTPHGWLWEMRDGEWVLIYPTWERACTEPEWEVFA